jgi:hypothetical protein
MGKPKALSHFHGRGLGEGLLFPLETVKRKKKTLTSEPVRTAPSSP